MHYFKNHALAGPFKKCVSVYLCTMGNYRALQLCSQCTTIIYIYVLIFPEQLWSGNNATPVFIENCWPKRRPGRMIMHFGGKRVTRTIEFDETFTLNFLLFCGQCKCDYKFRVYTLFLLFSLEKYVW